MKTIKVALAGAGAFGIKHLDAIAKIDGVEVVSLVSRDLEKTAAVARQYGIPHVTTELNDSLALAEVDVCLRHRRAQVRIGEPVRDGAGVLVEGELQRGLSVGQDRSGRSSKSADLLKSGEPGGKLLCAHRGRRQRDHERGHDQTGGDEPQTVHA